MLVYDDMKPTHNIFQAFFAVSRPKHPFIKAVIDEVVQNVQTHKHKNNIFELTGPSMFGKVLKQRKPKHVRFLYHRLFIDDSIITEPFMYDDKQWLQTLFSLFKSKK